ncbi:MAG: DUF6817 domain-containing protein [Pseudomonadota bacterium]
MFTPRQTNTGLYVHLHERGFSKDDIRRVQGAYVLACNMFNARYRKTGRAFICHAVGAASACAEFIDDIDVVIASLLHAGYDSGLFPDGKAGNPSAKRRQWMRDHIGEVSERLAHDYQSVDFDRGGPEQILQSGPDKIERNLLMMALTHELDDMADGGLAFAPKYGESVEGRLIACAALAEHLGETRLADLFKQQVKAQSDYEWMHDLKADELRGFWIVPNLLAYLRLRKGVAKGRWARLY